jgi:CRP-like cAMP-binding protein
VAAFASSIGRPWKGRHASATETSGCRSIVSSRLTDMLPRSPNKVLAALSSTSFRRIEPALRTDVLTSGSHLPDCGLTRVYFPGTGMCSMASRLTGGDAIEIALIGNEGIAGLPAVASDMHPVRDFAHVSDGSIQYMSLLTFEHERASDPQLRKLVEDCSQLLLTSMMQAIACTRLHSVQQRLASWLLTAQDRLGRPHFELTPALLARGLGIARSSLAPVIARLEEKNIVKLDGHAVTIQDEYGLQRLACDCFGAAKKAREAILPKPRTVKSRSPHPPAGRATVLRIPTANVCTLCNLAGSHPTMKHCIAALDEEIWRVSQRAITLRHQRMSMIAERLEVFRKFLGKSS